MAIKPISILVCGGRDYSDKESVFAALDHMAKSRVIELVIHGGASGADSLAGEWADARGIFSIACMADWKARGKKAGPIRNKMMLTLKPDGVVAFPGGSGTADMIRQAKAAGLNVWEPFK